MCEECQRQMKVNNWQSTNLFFAHVREVLGLLKAKHPLIKFIMWDDMFRETELEDLKGDFYTTVCLLVFF